MINSYNRFLKCYRFDRLGSKKGFKRSANLPLPSKNIFKLSETSYEWTHCYAEYVEICLAKITLKQGQYPVDRTIIEIIFNEKQIGKFSILKKTPKFDFPSLIEWHFTFDSIM